jgi:hypothetical protein
MRKTPVAGLRAFIGNHTTYLVIAWLTSLLTGKNLMQVTTVRFVFCMDADR